VSLKGKGADLFFGDYDPTQRSQTTADDAEEAISAPTEPTDGAPAVPVPPADDAQPLPSADRPTTTKRTRIQTTRRTQPAATEDEASDAASNHASMLAINENEREVVEAIRKVVKAPGREVSFVRLTAEEKAQLADIVYTYKRQGQKTSETEINRIAINYILADYHEHGERSILARVLAALLA
jgi:hypothetical protein